MICNKQQNLLI